MYDCAIIGTGAAGVSAALTLKSLNVNFVWFGKRELSEKISRAEKIKNYPGLTRVSGDEMSKAFLSQIDGEGIRITEKQVNGIYDLGGRFGILCGGDTYEARTVILAVGVETVKPVRGETEFLGKGVSYCATCDGFLYKGKKIVVVCTDKSLEHEAAFLAEVAEKVYFCPLYKGAELKAENAETISSMPLSVEGKDRAERVVFKDRTVEADGVFMLKASVAPSVLMPSLKCESGHVTVDRACRTDIGGVFAAGDCTGRPYQYAKAAGEGNVAAHSVFSYLSEAKEKEGGTRVATVKLRR